MKTHFALFLWLTVGLSAQQWEEVRPIHQSAAQYWKQQKLAENTHEHGGFFCGREWPQVWSYWAIKTGENYDNFQLEPLCFQPSAATAWNCPFWRIPGQDSPAISGVYGYLAATAAASGMGIAFRNPTPHAIHVNVEGSFRNYQENWEDIFYLFKQDVSGKKHLLKSSLDVESHYTVPGNPAKDDKPSRDRLYFRLGVRCRLEPNERIFLMLHSPGVEVQTNARGKWQTRFCLDEGQGKYYRPLFVITDINPVP